MELDKIFKQYKKVLRDYDCGYITKSSKDNKLTDLYEMSGYTNVLDFYLDYLRWDKQKYIQLTLF